MHALLVFVIVAVLSFEFLISKGFLPPIFKYTFEVFALLIAGVVLVLGVQSRFRNVPPKYWLVFGALVVIMVCGVFVNGVQPGPIFGGLRMYLRGLPFFLLPLVLLIPKRHVKVQLLVLLAFCVIQLPLAWDQRMATIARGGVTGDDTFGTLMMAKAMTLYLISGACIVTGFYLRGGLRGKYYFPLLAILLIPNMLNETKATLFLVPLGVITVYLVAARPGVRLRNSVIALTLVAAFTAVCVPVYDHFMAARWD